MAKRVEWTPAKIKRAEKIVREEIEKRGRSGYLPRSALLLDITYSQLDNAIRRGVLKVPAQAKKVTEPKPKKGPAKPSRLDEATAMVSGKPTTVEARVRTLDELLKQFNVDKAVWKVDRHVVNTWEVFSNQYGLTTLFQCKAWLEPHVTEQHNLALAMMKDQEQAMARHAPKYSKPLAKPPIDPDLAHMLEVAVFDPHIGLYAWHSEVGADYDSKIAVDGYLEAVQTLAAVHKWYNTERIVFPVGNDLLHVDQTVEGKGGATTHGTQQDVDTRFKKMFATARSAVIEALDYLRTIAPVDVVIVPGNHDEERVFMLGDVLTAWYRNDDRVSIDNRPLLRKYYQYGKNLIGYTHGLESRRTRDNLPLIMSTEAPPEMWASTEFREWHTGHNHTRFEIKWLPQWEERGIRVRSLPAIVPEDSWHYKQGYQHQRSAECLVWNREKGFAGIHSFNIK